MPELRSLLDEALYKEIRTFEDGRSLVMDVTTDKLYFKKTLSVYSIPVFSYLRDHSHPNIPHIEHFREEDGKLIVIEELIQGKTLEEILAKNELSFAEKKRILLAVCDGLMFLHGAKPPIIHRDLKASNIMVTDSGDVKLIDYDAAKVYVEEEKKDTVLIGTHGIAAPEQYGFAQSDARTDIYALGKLLERLMPDTKSAKPVIEKATRLEPDKRYSSAEQIRSQISRLREEPEKKRNIWPYIAAGTAVIGAVLVFYFAWYYPEYKVKRPAYEAGVDALSTGNVNLARRKFEICGMNYKDAEALLADAEERAMEADFAKLLTCDVSEAIQGLDPARTVVGKYDYASLTEEQKALFRDYVKELMDIATEERAHSFVSNLKVLLKGTYGEDDLWNDMAKLSGAECNAERGEWKDGLAALASLTDENYPGAAECRKMLIDGALAETKEKENAFLVGCSIDDGLQAFALYRMLAEEGPELKTQAEAFYKEMYDFAIQRREKGESSKALRLLKTLQDISYENAESEYTETLYQVAAGVLAEGNWTEAVTKFEELAGYRDADRLADEARYGYCLENAEKPDDTAYDYMKVLLANGYEGAEALQQEMTKWRAEVTLTVSYSLGANQGAVVNADLYGGPEDGETYVRIDLTSDDGTHISEKSEKPLKRGENAYMQIYNVDLNYVLFDHTYSVRVYDGDGNLIGTFNGKIDTSKLG